MIISILFLFLSSILFFSSRWAFDYFGLSCFEQIVFHLKVPLEGTNTEFIFDWMKQCLKNAIILTIVICLPLFIGIYNDYFSYIAYIVSIILLGLAAHHVGLFEFIVNLFCTSNIYEDNYVDARSVNLSFPEKKKNLIHIYIESLEVTYTSKENGGNYTSDLIYPLSDYAKQNINFSNTNLLGGAKVLSGTGWTTGALVAQSSGVPLLVPLNQKRFSDHSDFLPGIYGLGDILEKEGYTQEYLIGSDAVFGGRKYYYKKHGNYKIFDLNTAYEKAKIPEDYKEFWGYEDNKLITFAKEELVNLANQDQPFNFTMLTVDTHHPYGYVCDNCKQTYDERLSNVIACNSEQIGSFIEWIEKQDFYQDTVVVVSGDHLSMAAEYINQTYDSNYERTVFNMFMNSKMEAKNTKNRQFSTFDIFPTILASMGVNIQGDRLALGVNLFSNQKTIIEELGYTYVDKELRKQSKFYKQKILKNK